MDYAIEVKGLKKMFGSKKKPFYALDGIDLKVERGEVFGLLGPNGAGKTTTIYILTTLLTPTSGTVKVLGNEVTRNPGEVRSNIGICLGNSSFLHDLNPRETLEYFGRLMGMDKAWRRRNIDWLIDILDITPFEKVLFEDLSTGMRQKVAVAKAFLNDPKVVFLDEPTAGLDVEVAEDIRKFVMDRVRETKLTVILTSHQLYEVEEMCKKIAVIDKGKIIAEGEIDRIRKRMGFPDIIRLYLDRYGDLDFLNEIDGVLSTEVSDSLKIEAVSGLKVLNKVITSLKRRGYVIKDIEVRKSDLKDMFLKIVKGGNG
jgi:ABC-2 type transport system ATP-binding protein